jgi:peptide-methionine (R)-S-oxide reductase
MTIRKTEAEWKAELTPEQFDIMRKKGTERAFTGKYWDCHDKGTYACAGCGTPLFASDDKFDSGSGWPSFTRPLGDGVATEEDRSHFMTRTEVLCSACGAHLGHVFDDGPASSGGLRYCINSASIDLEKKG